MPMGKRVAINAAPSVLIMPPTLSLGVGPERGHVWGAMHLPMTLASLAQRDRRIQYRFVEQSRPSGVKLRREPRSRQISTLPRKETIDCIARTTNQGVCLRAHVRRGAEVAFRLVFDYSHPKCLLLPKNYAIDAHGPMCDRPIRSDEVGMDVDDEVGGLLTRQPIRRRLAQRPERESDPRRLHDQVRSSLHTHTTPLVHSIRLGATHLQHHHVRGRSRGSQRHDQRLHELPKRCAEGRQELPDQPIPRHADTIAGCRARTSHRTSRPRQPGRRPPLTSSRTRRSGHPADYACGAKVGGWVRSGSSS